MNAYTLAFCSGLFSGTGLDEVGSIDSYLPFINISASAFEVKTWKISTTVYSTDMFGYPDVR